MSDKRTEAEATLPSLLHEILDELITDYKSAAETHTKLPWVNYKILADLVSEGWRKG